MIKAGSLFYAIVISLIIALISSSLILFAYLSRIEFDNYALNERIQSNVVSGLNLLMSKQSIVELNQQKTIDLYGEGNDLVTLSRKSWGAYEIIISKAGIKNTQITRIAQVGYYLDSLHSYSLYLADQDKPLALCGDTKIKGTTYLPKAGIKRAYIEGQNFKGITLVDGQIKQSEKSIPKFKLKELLFIPSEHDSVVSIEGQLSGDTVNNSFNNKTLFFTSTGSLKISEGIYIGNIVIVSDRQITVSSDALLKDVILAAPKIILEKEFKGNIQAFASDSIIVDKDVSLYYPSVLGLISNDKSPNVSAIVLNENDTLMGGMFSQKNSVNPLKQTGIVMQPKSFVQGQVYSDGYVDAKGIIYGSVMCNKIMLRTSSSVYENHLLNAEIDLTKLSKYFVGINLVEESQAKKIVKWLN